MQPLEFEQADAGLLRRTRTRSYRCWAAVFAGAVLAAVPIVLFVTSSNDNAPAGSASDASNIDPTDTADDEPPPVAELLAAVKDKDIELVEKLLSDGASVDSRDAANGDTALMQAVRDNSLDMTRVLAEKHGADVFIRNEAGECAFDIAVGDEMQALMEEQGKKQSNFLAAVDRCNPDSTCGIQDSLTNGARVNWVTRGVGMSPLLLSSRTGNIGLVVMFLQAHADIDQPSNDGYTALMIAAVFDRLACMEELLAADANVDIQSKDGLTALMLTAKLDRATCVKPLLAAKADMTLKNKQGKTVMDFAHDPEIEDLLKREEHVAV